MIRIASDDCTPIVSISTKGGRPSDPIRGLLHCMSCLLLLYWQTTRLSGRRNGRKASYALDRNSKIKRLKLVVLVVSSSYIRNANRQHDMGWVHV